MKKIKEFFNRLFKYKPKFIGINKKDIFRIEYFDYWINGYDKNNNEIYHETSLNYWRKSEYDKNNNLIYYITSRGNWNKSKYDKNNNEIYFEDSTGYSYSCKYDDNNDLILHKDFYSLTKNI